MALLRFPDSVNDCIKYTPYKHNGSQLPEAWNMFLQMPAELPADARTYEWGAETDVITKTGVSASDLNSVGAASNAAKTYLKRRGKKEAENKAAEVAGKLMSEESDAIIKAVNRRRGRAEKGHEEMFFNDVGRRSFEFSHEMLAHSEEETNIIQQIISVFQTFAAPGETENQLEFSHWTYPSSWQISFLSVATGEDDDLGSNQFVVNQYLPTIGRCVLKDLNVEYFAEGYATFKNHAPVMVKISLTFEEMQLLSSVDTR